MVVGYAAFQTRLEIKGTSNISSNWNIKITNVTKAGETGSAEEAKAPTWTDLTAYMEANLYDKGDSIEYNITVENNGTLDATLENVKENLNSENEAVKISFSGYTKGQKLYKNTSQIITVKIEYNPDFEGTAEESSKEVSVDLNYVQTEGSSTTPTDKYLVTYDCTANGGNDCSSYNEYLNENDSVNLFKTPTKEGYTFIGWNTDKNAEGVLNDLTMPSADITLYAKWIDDIKPTLSLDPNTQATYVKNKAVTVKLEDTGSGLAENQKIYYAWSTSNNTAPSYNSYITATNAAGAKTTTVTVPATSNSSLTGTYYLWIKADSLTDISGNTSLAQTSGEFKFDNTDPSGDIIFTGNVGTEDNLYYFAGPTWGTVPYSSATSNDAHSGVKTSSLTCTSSNTNVATVSNTGTKTNITIKSTKGTTNNYHYLQERSTIDCTLSITDNAGNTSTVSKSVVAGNGWLSLGRFTCASKGVEYKNWAYSNGLNKVVGWVYVYYSTLNTNIYYYISSDGSMLRGWQKIGGIWYYLNDQCAYNVSYKTTSNYAYPDGGMLWNDTLIRISDNAQWTFNSSGACTSGSGC